MHIAHIYLGFDHCWHTHTHTQTSLYHHICTHHYTHINIHIYTLINSWMASWTSGCSPQKIWPRTPLILGGNERPTCAVKICLIQFASSPAVRDVCMCVCVCMSLLGYQRQGYLILFIELLKRVILKLVQTAGFEPRTARMNLPCCINLLKNLILNVDGV